MEGAIPFFCLFFFALVVAYPTQYPYCQPQLGDTVMAQIIQNDTAGTRCPLRLMKLDGTAVTNITNTSIPYSLQVRLNWGINMVGFILSASSGRLSLNPNFVGQDHGFKDGCTEGWTGITWQNIADQFGNTWYDFQWQPASGVTDVKFAVTCAVGQSQPVFQSQLFVGDYFRPQVDTKKGNPALAVVVALMVIFPMAGVVTYYSYTKIKPYLMDRFGKGKQVEEDAPDEEEGEIETTKPKRQDKFEKLEDDEKEKD